MKSPNLAENSTMTASTSCQTVISLTATAFILTKVEEMHTEGFMTKRLESTLKVKFPFPINQLNQILRPLRTQEFAEISWKRNAQEIIANTHMTQMSASTSGKMDPVNMETNARKAIKTVTKKILRQTSLSQARNMDRKQRILRISSHPMSQLT